MQPKRKIRLIDTTLRDGEQAPGVHFSAGQRLAIATRLAEAGIDEIEVGTPAMGEADREVIRQTIAMDLPCRLTGWCRADARDLQAALECGLSAIHLSFPVSDILLSAMRKDRTWLDAQIARLLPEALEKFAYVSIGAQDASRASWSDLMDFAARLAETGAHRLRLADTVGVWNPLLVASRVTAIRDIVPSLELAVHMHNDLGMATANTLTALQAGADAADVTVLGIGERAGNAPLEEVAMAVAVADDLCSNVSPSALPALCKLVAEISGRPITPNKPVIGRGIFQHQSGIHVNAMLRDSRAYEAFAPELLGESGPHRQLLIGRSSGRAALRHILCLQGIEPTDAELVVLLATVRDLAARSRRSLDPQELRWLYELQKSLHHATTAP